ncbi:MAG: hypothetical protein DLM69_00040 [Candidatus Chloroheliales bacterium]|nr:MAG: hypothetical protein DLM69_00040 [Chloroflexota bacterium]
MYFLTDEVVKGTDWRAVERAVARVMSHCGWDDIRIVGASNDGGGDVVATRVEEDQQKVFVVQVKSVTGDNYVRPSAINEVIHALTRYGGDVAVVATNGEFTPAAYHRHDALNGKSYDVRLWTGNFLQALLHHYPDHHPDRRQLRPYQQEIVDKCLAKFEAESSRVQFVVATGLGKTVIAAEIAYRLFKQGLKRILVLCHSQELALQLEQSFWSQLDKDIPTRVFFEGSMPRPYEGINFGLYQTFVNYLSGINPDDYDVVIVDEAHHAMAYGFRRALNHLEPRLLIGMTATPWRGDGASINNFFGTPIAQVSLIDGMKMGYLAQSDYRIYYDTIPWEEVTEQTHGRLTVRDLNKSLFVPQRDDAVVEELVKQCENIANPRVIVFCPSVEHSLMISNLLNATTNLKCKPLSGVDRIERSRNLLEFATGKIQAVTAVDVLNEGIDVPDVNVLVFLRSTHSRRIFVQQLGRGLRLAPNKEKVLVLDFVTDIRRLAEVVEMDRYARQPKKHYEKVVFPQGIVTFMNEGTLSFVEQWLRDVADLGDAPDSYALSFPEESK